MKLPAFYEKMNRRERLLSASVAGVLFLLLNLFIWSWLFGMAGRARTELAAQRAARKQQSVYLNEKNLWAKRDQWLQQKQPSLKNAAEASSWADRSPVKTRRVIVRASLAPRMPIRRTSPPVAPLTAASASSNVRA